MRLILALLLCFWSGSVHAANQNQSIFSVADYGAVPGDQSGLSVDNAIDSIRAAIFARDAASGLSGRYKGATIRFPASDQPWVVGRPHWIDQNRWEVAGDGRDNTKIATRQGWSHPAFIFGWPMRPDPVWATYKVATLTSAFHPDAFGVLDASACSAAGKAWGVSLTPQVSASFPVSPFSSGPGDGRRYQGLRQHLIEFLYVPADPTIAIPAGNLFGFGTWQVSPIGGKFNTLRLGFNLSADGLTPQPQIVDIQLGTALQACYRVTIQLDFDSGVARAWSNGVQVVVIPSPLHSAQFIAGCKYYGNDLNTFSLGYSGARVDGYTSAVPILGGTFYGLRMSDRLVYVDGGVGTPQTRIDGLPITDYSRYFDPLNGCFGYLTMTDPPIGNPACVAESRLLTWIAPRTTNHSPVNGFGFLVFNSNGKTPGQVSYSSIRDLSIWASGDPSPVGAMPFGQAVAVGSTLGFNASRLDLTGGAHGIGSLNFWPSWGVRYDDLRLAGTDAGLYSYWQLMDARTIFQSRPVRTGLRFYGGGATIRGVLFGDTNALTEANIMIHGDEYGGQFHLEEIGCDSEAGGGPLYGAVVMENCQYTSCRLRVVDLDCGKLPASAVPIMLRGSPRGNQVGSPCAIVDGVSVYTAFHRAAIARQSPLWNAAVVNSVQVSTPAVPIPLIVDEFPAH